MAKPNWMPEAFFDFWKKFGGRFVQVDPASGVDPTPDTFALPINYIGPQNNKKAKEKMALYQTIYETFLKRDKIIKQLREMRYHPLIQTITDIFIDDAFMSNSRTEVYNVRYNATANKKKIQARMDYFTEKFKMQDFALEIIPQLMLYGEHIVPYKTHKDMPGDTINLEKGKKKKPNLKEVIPKEDDEKFDPDKGIVEISDNAILEQIIPIWKGMNIVSFAERTNDPQKPLNEYDPDKFVYFCLPGEKIPVKVKDDSKGHIKVYHLPEHTKMGKSMFFNVIDKIRKLDSLEASFLAMMLQKALTPRILGVGIPAGTPIKEVRKQMEYYERYLEDVYREIANVETFDAQTITRLSNKVKVIPSYLDGKGALELLTLSNDQSIDKEAINDLRREISVIIGFPYYYISIAGDPKEDRLLTLKIHSRYSKNCNSLQRAMKNGLKQFYVYDLKAAGHNVKESEIEIDFKEIVNIDTLDNMEFVVTASSALREVFDMVIGLAESEQVNFEVNQDVVLNLINEIFDNFPVTKNILKKGKPPAEEPAEGEGEATGNISGFEF
jgi:hypothetical protein